MRPGAQLFQFESLLEDEDLVDEIKELAASDRLGRLGELRGAAEAVERRIRAGDEGIRAESAGPSNFGAEAIVLTHGRPSLLVRNGTYEEPDSPTWRSTLALHRSNIEEAIARVGRVELFNHPYFEWVGTAWIVAPQIVVTNRHVAKEFARKTEQGYEHARNRYNGDSILSKVDFREEYEINDEVEVPVAQILYIAPDDAPDIALLRLEGDVPLPDPIPLADGVPEQRQLVGVIGYPAFDSRNGADAMRRYFGEVYDVKRFAPGRVMDALTAQHYFKHDPTTLGGNSGSAVIALETGDVVGLHFSGEFKHGNFAVKTEHIKSALSEIGPSVHPVPAGAPELVEADRVNAPAHFAGRAGYDRDFLGLTVDLPGLGSWVEDVADVEGADPERSHEARYCHFTVVTSKSRKLPLIAAVNIDGQNLLRIPRTNIGWFEDGRIANEFQIGNEAYRSNDLDRGHMVRRLDPVWGDREEAALANEDTFHYANAAPQHKNLNRKDWVRLEDDVLDFAAARDLKLCVFTGPVFRDDDRWYKRGADKIVQLPREFWKVVALIDDTSERLSTAGFILSQGEMIRDFTEVPFVAGRSSVYQVQISRIEQVTGLDFGGLKGADAFAAATAEAVVGRRAWEITAPTDIVLLSRRNVRPAA